MKTHYEILEVPATASNEQIRKAFRTLAFQFHPDLTLDDADASMFIRIREAYEVLADDNRRTAYDAELEEERRVAEKRQKEASRHVSVERPKARQAYSPVFTEHRLTRPVDAEIVDMSTIERHAGDVFGSMEIALEESIRPASFTILLPDDTDTLTKGKLLIRLPGKIHRDAVLRVKGQGANIGGERGDLFIEVIFSQHPNFRICAESLFHDIAIQPWQAALGFEALIPTLEGIERVTIPPFLSSPCIRKLEGKGIYKRNGERGDIWINLKLEVPPPTSFRARRLWAELAEEYRHNSERN